MKENPLKAAVRAAFFRTGSIRRVRFGPLRGMVYRVGPITGMSPWYSGVEREIQSTFCDIIRPGDTVIDVGANWGLHTLLLSHLVGSQGTVIAIEPYPPAREELEWHVRANGCKNITVLQVALSSKDGTSTFVPGPAASMGKLTDPDCPEVPVEGFSVRTRTLDSILAELDLAPRLIKVDVEGAEGLVLQGATSVMGKLRPHFIVELHAPEQDLLVAKLLTAHSYRLARLEGPPILYLDQSRPATNGVWGTILASPHQSAET